MLKIQNKHVDWQHRWIRILTENSKTELARVIPFERGSRLEELLRRRAFLGSEAYVFGHAKTGEYVGDCIHNRARLYHVRHRPLYHAIGEPESRHRRPVPARRAVERLMMLDAVLELPHLNWLTTDAEKLRLVTPAGASTTAPERTDGPTERAPNRLAEPFGVQFPIGLQPDGRAVFLYLATVPWTDEFRGFLQAHARLLIALPLWTLRLVFPQPLDRVYDDYQRVVREELETPLHRVTTSELKSYFSYRREAANSEVHPFKEAVIKRGAEVFGAARFTLLYRRWLKHGDGVFDAVSSSFLADSLATGTARVESFVLPHTYRHLSPLAELVRSRVDGVEKGYEGVEKGEQRGEQSPARPQPPPSTPSSDPLTIA